MKALRLTQAFPGGGWNLIWINGGDMARVTVKR
jgi:hypothetical protein